MDQKRLHELTAKLEQEKDLCTWASVYAMLTWNKIGFIRSLNRGRISETTLTQDLVYQFYLMAQSASVPVQIFEAWDEAKNGNDLEFFIEKPDGYVCLPMQAKLLGRDHRYSRISHKVGSGYQLDSLIDYAARIGGVPLYLFYNSLFSSGWLLDYPENKTSIEEYGCSFVHADYIEENYCITTPGKAKRSWRIPTFDELHPDIALPFSDLFCGFVKQPVENWPSLLKTEYHVELSRYSYDEISDEGQWNEISGPERISGFQDRPYVVVNEEEYNRNLPPEKGFDPKFRIVISTETKSRGGLYHLS